MNDLCKDDNKTVTTKELAEILGVDESTVTKTVNRLNETSDVLPKFSQGQTPRYTEEQTTIIKQEIQKHHNLANRQIDIVSTELEENLMIAKAFTILQRRNSELQARCEAAERLNNQMMHSSHLYTITEIAKELGLTSGAKLNEILEKKGVQYKVNGTWVHTCKYSERGYFEIKQQVHDDTGYVYYDRKVTQEGRRFILELMSRSSDENKSVC